MKKFIFKVVHISIPVFIFLVSINYFGDAARVFDSEYENQMAIILSSGNFVTNIKNYDERIFQKEIISKLHRAPDIAVLGSSRTMLINSTFFPSQTFFNSSVSGASLEDLIALFKIYETHNIVPQKVIIGIDPWLLNKNNGQLRWKSLEHFYNRYKNEADTKSTFYSVLKFSELISLSYFQASLESAIGTMSASYEPEATMNKYNETNTKLIDGSLVYGSEYMNATQQAINLKIEKYITGGLYGLENFEEISDGIWSEFKEFILYMQNHGVLIEFFLSPYAPLVFDKISTDYPNVLKTESLILTFASSRDIKIYGSFNPYSLGFDEFYFYDGMHCKEMGIKELLMYGEYGQ